MCGKAEKPGVRPQSTPSTLRGKTPRVDQGLQEVEPPPFESQPAWIVYPAPLVRSIRPGLDPSQTSAFCRLARSRKLDYAGPVASGAFPPTPYLLFQLRIKFFEHSCQRRMTNDAQKPLGGTSCGGTAEFAAGGLQGHQNPRRERAVKGSSG